MNNKMEEVRIRRRRRERRKQTALVKAKRCFDIGSRKCPKKDEGTGTNG